MAFNEQTPKQIAADVLKLSDYYIANPNEQTPWSEKFCQNAYRNYFLPLNKTRLHKVLQRGLQTGFFENLKHFIDWGCGPATASTIIKKVISEQYLKFTLIDRYENLPKIFEEEFSGLGAYQFFKQTSLESIRCNPKETCLVFSYSLTEQNQLPAGWNQFEALMIIEPSTQDDSRKLMDLRKTLIDHGYTIWAPCTHQNSCPLLELSKRDWCHDKTEFNAPDFFLNIEEHLPIKNNVLTFSYLLARKMTLSNKNTNMTRVVGDALNEKGKTRQLICRGPEREFLTWMHKTVTPDPAKRGELIILNSNLELKSNEIRLKSNTDFKYVIDTNLLNKK